MTARSQRPPQHSPDWQLSTCPKEPQGLGLLAEHPSSDFGKTYCEHCFQMMREV